MVNPIEPESYHRKLIWWLLFLGSLLTHAFLKPVYGQNGRKTQVTEPVRVLALHQLPDPDSRITLEQAQNIPLRHWQPVSAVNFGSKGRSGWVVSQIYSLRAQEVKLELQTPFIDTVQVWLFTKNDLVKKYPTTGYWRLPHSSHNPNEHRYYLFTLPLEANQAYQVYIRGYVKPGFSLKFAVQYWQPAAFWWHMRYVDWHWALFVGMITMTLGITVIRFGFYPRRIYVYFAGYIFSLALYALLNDGWGIFLPAVIQQQVNPITNHYLLSLGLCFLLLFSRRFLHISKQAPHWWLRINPWWLCLLLIVFIDLAQFASLNEHLVLLRFVYRLGLLVALVAALIWISYLRHALRQGFQPAWLLLCSQLVMLLVYFFTKFLENTGLLPHILPDMLLFRLALVTEITIITIGWLYRQKVIRESKEQLQGQRERMARDLHDSIGSQLTHIVLRLDSLVRRTSGEFQEQTHRLADFTRGTIQMLRETIWVLDQKRLSVSSFANRLQNFLHKLWEGRENPVLNWEFLSTATAPELSPLVAQHLFYITQEAINNALKYACATRIDVRLATQIPNLVLTITDNGGGFDLANTKRINGINYMRKRAEEVGGQFFITSTFKKTEIKISMPIILEEYPVIDI
ncbi:sensor histidine kinase [Adhaeribacter radiodurans]|uniref:Histidine kinase/HSP90-like ATPase domain-containing protein n=1 Tax=Adhaeribacter radiodurans TaxID=2745197 RepID=A0A7L7L218_9BACT|nr:7TM diverse intracellular signaling domain-containing protein [Adhaeribacter radiodurans]QMU26832.1 hypothetical protein HUW48_01745 [Adhaeribacter radiodurans]